jgi:hypothetical protein
MASNRELAEAFNQWSPGAMSLGDAIIKLEDIISKTKGDLWSFEIALELMKEEQRRRPQRQTGERA